LKTLQITPICSEIAILLGKKKKLIQEKTN